MNDIPSVWSFAALLLFGVTLTALPAGAAILLAESWSQKMRKEESISRLGKTGISKFGKNSSGDPFSG